MLTVWDQTNSIVALAFYTTANNTGIHKWAAKLLESMLGRKVFFLACHHHVLELIDGAVWEQLFGNVMSPENPELKEAWSGINMENFNTWNLVHESMCPQ